MVFNSLQYAAFLPLVLALYWRLGRRGQNRLLLVASYVFYGLWDWRFCLLMAFTTAVDFAVGRALAATEDERRRRLVFAVSLVTNLGVLGFFKYAGFFVDSAARLLSSIGIDGQLPTLRILLPVGISFYTFHGISYTFDVFRREVRPAASLLDFAVFVAFFPQLVAGPIGRAQLQLPQFESDRTPPDRDAVRSSLCLILLGLFKKVVIADALAPFVTAAFSSAASAGWVNLLVGVYAFALQIYGDFSGYTDIARGSARLLGIELPGNFAQPYLSRDVTEFWRRWHISLSNWLRDYLYVPLGGNRRGRWATYRNLMITMLLGGLWHGAAWTFVAWGGLHGLFLVAERVARARPARPRLPTAWRVAATFHLVCVAWIFFRATSFANALDVVRGIVTLRPGPVDANALTLLLLAGAATLAIDLSQRGVLRVGSPLSWPPAPRGAVLAALGLAVVVFSGGAPVPFIYFQF